MEGSHSPVATGSPAAEELTPRSKVAKMLADIDDAPTPSPPQRAPTTDKATAASGGSRVVTSTVEHSGQESPKRLIAPAVAVPSQNASQSESDEEELDGPVRRPQGRAARRMLGIEGGSPTSRSKLASSPPSQRHAPQEPDSDDELYSATPLRPSLKSREMSGSPLGSAKSGNLFVSPAKSTQQDSDDEELPSNPLGSKEKLTQLVAKKREERLRQEENERKKQAASEKRADKVHRAPSGHASSDLPEGILDDGEMEPNPEVEKLMSDAARPTRKASKRALLEMERETQRLARQQALAHQMKVKKRFTTSDLLARFKVQQPAQIEQAPADTLGDTTASSAPNSDAVEPRSRDPVSTPPSSPPAARPTPLDKQTAIVEQGALSKLMPVREDSIASLAQMVDDEEDELPDIADIMRPSQTRKYANPPDAKDPDAEGGSPQPKKGLRLARLGKKAVIPKYFDNSSDDDLEIIAPMPAHLRAFDKVRPQNSRTSADSKAIHTLKHLSHIGAYEGRSSKPGRGVSRPSVGAKTLEAQLRRKAKEQARQQQRERIEELKAKGIVIQSAEEREKEAEVFENLLEKARQDAVVLRKLEKAAAKTDAGEEGAVEVSDDEDEDYIGSEEEEGEGEQSNEEDDVDGEGLVDDAAEESEENAEEMEEDIAEEGVERDVPDAAEVEDQRGQVDATPSLDVVTPAPANRKPRQSRIIRDDDEDEDGRDNCAVQNAPAAPIPSPEAQDPFAAFNFGANGNSANALMSPEQAFQATMQTPTQATQEDSFDILRKIAPPSISSLPPTLPIGYGESYPDSQDAQQDGGDHGSVVPSSQVPESQRINLMWETQPPETPTLPGFQRGVSGLSETPGWEPTQDQGLKSPWTGGLRREGTLDSNTEDRETQSTVRLRVSESPAAKAPAALRRGRLVRRQAVTMAESSEDEDEDDLEVPAEVAEKDAFREMARKRKDALTAAERAEANKEMKHMLEEQAEESEDEYAGLGGDDFVAPENEQDRDMIDSSHVDVDERQLAKLFAEKQRQREEEETSRLYKDLTTGALRRKQANVWGLEEDEDEIAMRRRQMRQMEEARKRKLLLQDENLAGLAQGKQTKGKDAFLKAIADDDDGDELLDVSDAEDDGAAATQEESQEVSQQQPESAGPLTEVSGNKRRLAEDEHVSDDRPAAKHRRTATNPFKKPANMLEVRESLSFLLDEPDTSLVGPTVELESDSENEDRQPAAAEEDDEDLEIEMSRQNDGGFAPNPADFDRQAMPPPRLPASERRTPAPARAAIVDRLSLKRGSSATNDSAHSRTAWAAPAIGGGFKAPSLLRRATTNTGGTGANDRGVTVGSASLSRENSGSGVKMGGSKKSSLAYQARAEERKAIVEASARRREENTKKIAQMRRNSSMLGKGLAGRFE